MKESTRNIKSVITHMLDREIRRGLAEQVREDRNLAFEMKFYAELHVVEVRCDVHMKDGSSWSLGFDYRSYNKYGVNYGEVKSFVNIATPFKWMPTVIKLGSYTIFIWTNDHEPVHVYVCQGIIAKMPQKLSFLSMVLRKYSKQDSWYFVNNLTAVLPLCFCALNSHVF